MSLKDRIGADGLPVSSLPDEVERVLPCGIASFGQGKKRKVSQLEFCLLHEVALLFGMVAQVCRMDSRGEPFRFAVVEYGVTRLVELWASGKLFCLQIHWPLADPELSTGKTTVLQVVVQGLSGDAKIRLGEGDVACGVGCVVLVADLVGLQ